MAQRSTRPVVSVVIPTRGRAEYLDVALASLARQDLDQPYEVIVVDDGSSDRTPEVVAAAGVRSLRHERRRTLNAARNSGAGAAGADLIAFTDDDVEAPAGWLRELVEGAARHPEAEAFGGPIRARLEGPSPRGCGREPPPLTTLDLGPDDREAARVWGANMAVRRSALERVHAFDESIVRPHGDEEEWIERLQAAGGTVVYLARAGLDHRRAGKDLRLRSLARAAYVRGRAARASDRRRHAAPSLGRELRVLAGCGWHTVRRACPQGVIMGAHSAGRLAETVRPR
jgi:glycosyltransferase involved in cell wall biosynthesis